MRSTSSSFTIETTLLCGISLKGQLSSESVVPYIHIDTSCLYVRDTTFQTVNRARNDYHLDNIQNIQTECAIKHT